MSILLARCGEWSFSRDIPEARHEIAKRAARIALASECKPVVGSDCCRLEHDALDELHGFDGTMQSFGWDHANKASCGAFFVADGELLTARHCIKRLADDPGPDEYVVLRHDSPAADAWTFCGPREIMAYPGASEDGEDVLRVAVGAELGFGERIPICDASSAESPKPAFALHHPIGVALVHDEVKYAITATGTYAAMDYGEYSSGGAVLASTGSGSDVCLVGLVKEEVQVEEGAGGEDGGAVGATQWSCGVRRGGGREHESEYPTETQEPKDSPTGAEFAECRNHYHTADTCAAADFNLELAVPSTPAS